MKVFVFDLVAYGEHFEDVGPDGELAWPLPKRHFKPEVAVRTFAEHLEAWEEMDRLGFDGVGFNEHHTSPYGLMNSPNLLAAAASQRTKHLKLAIYGNLLPLHDPLRLAEELAMLDCISDGRLICGLARGIPREHKVYGVPLDQSRARFEEAWEVMEQAWTEEVFTHKGQFWSYEDVAIWPRPVQQPYPPVWVPVTSSQETIEWAAKRNFAITPGPLAAGRAVREDITRHYTASLAAHGHALTPEHLVLPANAYVADSKAQAIAEAGPYAAYFNRTLFPHGNVTAADPLRQAGYLTPASFDYVRPENLRAVARTKDDRPPSTLDEIAQQAESLPWGSPAEVTARIIEDAEYCGAGVILLSLNRGAMPQSLFLNQLRRFGQGVLPALQAHEITRAGVAG